MDSKATDSIVTAIGIDIGKNTFHLVGVDVRGSIMLRQFPAARSRLASPTWRRAWRRRPSSEP